MSNKSKFYKTSREHPNGCPRLSFYPLFGLLYPMALVLSDSPDVVGSLMRFHTLTTTDTRITGFFTASSNTPPRPAQVVISLQLRPR